MTCSRETRRDPYRISWSSRSSGARGERWRKPSAARRRLTSGVSSTSPPARADSASRAPAQYRLGAWPRGLIEGRRADRTDQQGHANPRQQVRELVHSSPDPPAPAASEVSRKRRRSIHFCFSSASWRASRNSTAIRALRSCRRCSGRVRLRVARHFHGEDTLQPRSDHGVDAGAARRHGSCPSLSAASGTLPLGAARLGAVQSEGRSRAG